MKNLTIWKEVKKQLTNTPAFSLKIPQIEELASPHLQQLDQQIDNALKNCENRLVILLGPFGSGKTTQIHSYLRKRPELHYLYKSLVKINTLEMAFLHLTSYLSRLSFLGVFSLIALFLMKTIPYSGALPFLFIIGFFFVKNSGNLVYILHEALDNLCLRKHRLIILEDLERSSLSPSDQWAFLANLWQLKRSYLVSIGYSADNKKAKLQMIEYAQKLGGIIIEVPSFKGLNHFLIRQLDPTFPFLIDYQETTKKGAWLVLFTPREMVTLQEQVSLRALPDPSVENKQRQYIHVCLELLLAKLDLEQQHITYDNSKRQLKHVELEKLSPEQAYFLSSFRESLPET